MQPVRPDTGAGDPEAVAAPVAEVRRLGARLVPDALLANPAHQTAVLLGGPLPSEPLLPLGEVYASQIEELTGRWSAPEAVVRLAERCGGVHRLDAALRTRFDLRDPDGLRGAEPAVRHELEAARRRGAASRTHGWVVPKIGPRTLGVDLFE